MTEPENKSETPARPLIRRRRSAVDVPPPPV
ncbi:MAG: hypothetical protein RLZZ436_653, partial [Planctomycetota bacterium]